MCQKTGQKYGKNGGVKRGGAFLCRRQKSAIFLMPKVGDLKERFCPVVFSKKFSSKINGPIFQNRGEQKRSFLLLFYCVGKSVKDRGMTVFARIAKNRKMTNYLKALWRTKPAMTKKEGTKKRPPFVIAGADPQ